MSLQVSRLRELLAADFAGESPSFVDALLVAHQVVVTSEVLVAVIASVLLALMLGFRVLTTRTSVVEFLTAYLLSEE